MIEFLWVLIAALIVCNVGQFIYWSRGHSELIDKLMSRSYAEWAQTKAYRPLPKPAFILEDDDSSQEDEALKTLNGMLSR